jgi:hypothetical protein
MATKKKARVASAGASEIVLLDGLEFNASLLIVQGFSARTLAIGWLRQRHPMSVERASLIARLSGLGGAS